MAGRLKIAVAVPHGMAFIECALLGIGDFARRAGDWAFTRRPEGIGTSVAWLKHWRGDGAFVAIYDEDSARMARSLDFPVINLASYLQDVGVPLVCVDHAAIGRTGAEHLIGKKFRRFAFYGASRYWYSRLRQQGFETAVRQAGGAYSVFDADADPADADQQGALNRWVAALRPPVAIMASTDIRAGMVLEACRELRLRVPEDVAVLGVDNDSVFAELESPPLSSVSRNGRQVGWRAAELMRQLIDDPLPAAGTVFVPPGPVVERASTDTLASNDPLVGEIANYIRDHINERFGVERLLGRFSLSRRTLEYRFRAEVGATPYEFINGRRIEAAKAIFKQDPSVKTQAVAAACGFADERRLRLVFQQATGMNPSDYRRAVSAGIELETSQELSA